MHEDVLPALTAPDHVASSSARGGGRDRRVKVLALTPKGKSVRERALERMTDPPAALATLSPADQRALRDILRRLNLGERHSESAEGLVRPV